MARQTMDDGAVKKIIDSVYPNLSRELSPEEYSEFWSDATVATGAPTFGAACAQVPGREDVMVRVHLTNPWMPSPDEVRVLRAWLPSYIRTALDTYKSKEKLQVLRVSRILTPDNNVTPEFLDHLEEMGRQLQANAERTIQGA